MQKHKYEHIVIQKKEPDEDIAEIKGESDKDNNNLSDRATNLVITNESQEKIEGSGVEDIEQEGVRIRFICSNKLSQGDVDDYWIKKGSLIGAPDKNLEQYAGNCISIFTVPLFVSMLRNISILKYLKYLFKHPDRFRASKFLAFKMLAYRIFKKGSPIFKII